jgi:hypothetical protein
MARAWPIPGFIRRISRFQAQRAAFRVIGNPNSINPEAPAALHNFAFLIGTWRCEAKFKTPDSEWLTFEGTWVGRPILDGFAIGDEYRMVDQSGETVVLGLNIRAYDAGKQTWNMKWLNALAGTWTDLGPEELGGVRFDGSSIIYEFKEEVAGHPYTRATYSKTSETHFTWRGERSGDRRAWSEFMVIEAERC